jgi:hypothetical protein
MIAEDGDLERSAGYVVLRLDMACQAGDLRKAVEWRNAARRLQESNDHPRVQRWLRAADLRIRQLEGDLPPVDEAQRLLEHHKPNFEVGDIADFELGVSLWILSEYGATDLAEQVSEKYFRHNRRSLNPPNRIVREALSALGVCRERIGCWLPN